MKKFFILFSVVLILFNLISCSETTNDNGDEKSEVKIMLKATEEMIDLIPQKFREYISEAQKYDTNDYTYTIVDDYFQGTQLPNTPELHWNYENFEQIASAKLLVSLTEDFADPIVYNYDKPQKDSMRGYPTNLLTGKTYYWKVEATLEDGQFFQANLFHLKHRQVLAW